MISRARQHAYNESLADYSYNFGAYTKQHTAALDDLRKARAILPKNDGSKQWRLARRYASRVTYVVSYENRLHEDARAYNAVAWNKDVPAYNRAVQRVQSADKAYSAYVYQRNWAGYCAIGRRFTSVTATWIQPQLYVNGTTERRVSIWVGLDGWVPGSNTVQQTGIRYIQGEDLRAWYEMVPKLPVAIARGNVPGGSQDMVVNAGDTITATVTSLEGHRFKLTLVDNTQGVMFSTIQTNASAKCDSAEIIVEAHFGHGMGLADFDPVHFTNCAVDGRPITSFHWKISNITEIGHLPMTWTSPLRTGGSSFTVTRR